MSDWSAPTLIAKESRIPTRCVATKRCQLGVSLNLSECNTTKGGCMTATDPVANVHPVIVNDAAAVLSFSRKISTTSPLKGLNDFRI